MTDAEINILIKAQTDKATKEIKVLTKEIERLGKETEKMSAKNKGLNTQIKQTSRSFASLVGHVGKLMAIYGTATGVTSFTKKLAEMESALVDVEKTTGLSNEELAQFDTELQKISQSMQGVTYVELTNIAAEAGKLGIKGSENLTSFAKTIAMVGVATEYTAEQAATEFGRLAASTKLTIPEVENLASAVNELSQNTKATLPSIVEVSKRMAGTAEAFGLSASEIVAFAASMKDLGITSEVAGSAFRMFLQQMQTNVVEFASVAGVSLSEFTDMMKNEPIEAVQLFLKELGKLDAQAQQVKLEELGLSAGNVAEVMLKLANNSESVTKNIELSNKAFKENTSILKEYNIKSKSYAASMKTLTGSFEVFLKQVGGEFLDALAKGANELAKFMSEADPEKLENLSRQLGVLGESFIETVSFIADAVVATSDFLNANGALVMTILELVAGLKVATLIVKGFGGKGGALGQVVVELGSLQTLLPKVGAAISSMVGKMTKGNVALLALVAAIAAADYALNAYLDSERDAIILNDKYSEQLAKIIPLYGQINAAYDKNTNKLTANSDEQAKLALSLYDTIAANEKFIKLLKDDSAEKNNDKIKTLIKSNKILKESYYAITSLPPVFKTIEKDAESTITVTKKLMGANKEYIDKILEGNETRVLDSKMTIAKLYAEEKSLVEKVAALENEKLLIRQKYALAARDAEWENADFS